MSLLPHELQEALSTALQSKIHSPQKLSGGCIHQALYVESDRGPLFIKWNTHNQADNFRAEARGLQRLREAGALPVPDVLAEVQSQNHAALVLEFVVSAPRASHYWEDLGQKLALLHRHSQTQFGLDHDNYIGRLPQSNQPMTQGAQFFAQQRLAPMIQQAKDDGLLPLQTHKQLDKLSARINELIPEEAPAFLHGDLWSGNLMIGPEGEPWLIDPAVYYGHREAELAFTRLFGGFKPDFYQAYQEAFPLPADWEERVDLFNLYPLLVHLNLFGVSYLGQIQTALQRYI